ncbi:MAG: hypothetical protein IPJ89_03160 [Candidatus Iainarchaeum archaeon]|uniref:Pilus assembly protein n=1 Tax=Candidatus Iainarchaeum sp. TaxID=3101447 RepID=A0A7T9I1Y2_9ARCH|nr:MAG: hypothetical protein IPJ89_03160 [Candidatus Diapherotrites archaeon]
MKSLKKKQKGFVISVDALLALFVLFMMIGIAFETISQQGIDFGQRTRLREQAFYAGIALEQSRLIPKAVIGNNTTEIRSFLDSWPANVCASVSVYPDFDTNAPTLVVSKSSCTSATGIQERASNGVIVSSPPDANLYKVIVTTWVNQA